jgi:hypothetical protein
MEFVGQAVCGLNDLHSQQMVHGHLRPEHVLLHESGGIRIGLNCALFSL